MEDEAIIGFPEKRKKPVFISNLTINTAGMYGYDTNLMIGYYHEKIGFDKNYIQQIKNLGVNNRYFARSATQYSETNKEYHNEEVHRNYLLAAARKCLQSSSLEVQNLVVASEIADYQTPGLASTLLNPLITSKFATAFNLQGTACSSMPRCIELARHLQGNTLCLIDGITSDIYQTELMKVRFIKPKSQEWIKLMFGMLFGDATAAFIVGEEDVGSINYKVLRQAHAMNLGAMDYKNAAVKRGNQFEVSADKNVLDTALKYTDVVLTKMGIESFGHYERIILHTGSQKIINAYQDYYNFHPKQIEGSRAVLTQYGNTTGCSLPLVLNQKEFKGKALMIGITMGFGVDIVEIEV